jgi:hypothetical protein
VTVPYHPAKKAFLLKGTVNYVTWVPHTIDGGGALSLSTAIDIASADGKRIKLTHHPDGFIQFSGYGVVSGKEPDGKIKGIGVQSWPLLHGCRGPAFGIVVYGVEQFEQDRSIGGQKCLFSQEELTVIPGTNGLVLEGHYFPAMWRRFIQTAPDGSKTICIFHPTGNVLRLKVLLPPDRCPIGGFFGLDLFTHVVKFPGVSSGFVIGSSAGNIRKNEKGETLGDGLWCFYPPPDELPVRRSLDYDPSES